MSKAEILVFAYGNPGRGDDALGPKLLSLLKRDAWENVVLLNDMQLQIEHVTDMQGKSKILFVDADVSCSAPFVFERILAGKDQSYTSHAMTPQALLYAYEQAYKQVPPITYLMHIRGYDFELGEPVSANAEANMLKAKAFAEQFIHEGIKD